MYEQHCGEEKRRKDPGCDRNGSAISCRIRILCSCGSCLILAGISTVCSLAGVQVINPTTGETVLAKAIFSRDGIVWLLENLLKNFQGFSALGLVLAMQMAIGFAEGVGLLTAAMRKAILGVPLWALTATRVIPWN